jgi:two-component system, LytTR family, response regulator
MIRAVIVDDEPFARSNLRVLLAREADIQLAGEGRTGAEAIDLVRAERPDLLFLDVQMPEADGFDVVETLGLALPPAIVFVTAYDQYALRAFDAGALDYLLKPFDDARFGLSLARARERLALRPAPPVRIAIKTGREVVFVDAGDIDWIESADYCVALHVGDRTHLLRRSMDVVEREFAPLGFCRTHRTAIVNVARVERLSTTADGGAEVVLAGGVRLPLSRRHRVTLQERLGASA